MNLPCECKVRGFRRYAPLPKPLERFSHSHEHGSALVETALVMPIMLLMLTGIFGFAISLYQKLQLAEAVTAGGRTMATERGDTDPCATAAGVIYAAAPALSKSKMSITFTLGGTNSGGTVSGGTNYGTNVTTCTAAGNGGAAALQAGWPAQIYATYPCSLGIYNLGLGSCSIKAGVTEVIQ